MTASFLASLASSAVIRAPTLRRLGSPPVRPFCNAAHGFSSAWRCQRYERLGWIWYSSQSFEIGTWSARCRLRMVAFSSAEKWRRFPVSTFDSLMNSSVLHSLER